MRAELIDGKIREVEAKIVAMKTVRRFDRMSYYEGQLRRLQRMKSDALNGDLFTAAPQKVFHEPPPPRHNALSIRALCESGFHFCEICERIVEVNPDNHTCEQCGSLHVKFCQPTPA